MTLGRLVHGTTGSDVAVSAMNVEHAAVPDIALGLIWQDGAASNEPDLGRIMPPRPLLNPHRTGRRC